MVPAIRAPVALVRHGLGVSTSRDFFDHLKNQTPHTQSHIICREPLSAPYQAAFA